MSEKGKLRGKLALFIFIVLILGGLLSTSFVVQVTHAEEITVPDDYSTIQEAINNAQSGDTIFVRSGEYVENVTLNKTISLTGENCYNTVIKGSGQDELHGHPLVSICADDVHVSGFTIGTTRPLRTLVSPPYQCIYVKQCNGTLIQGNVLITYDDAIFVYESSGTSIIGNRIESNTERGILLINSRNCVVTKNTIRNSRYHGIMISEDYASSSSFNHTISHNTISNAGGIGIFILPSQGVVISQNLIKNCLIGIQISIYVHNVTVSENNIVGNSQGIHLLGRGPYMNQPSYDNSVFNNNFIDNSFQAICEDYAPSTNTFDSGYPSGGNYWSDYTGSDIHSGSSQDIAGSDGFGDQPYFVYYYLPWRSLGSIKDNYPLMKPHVVLFADLNLDGCVDVFDAMEVANSFGKSTGESGWNPLADLIQDNIVDIYDVIVLAGNFGKTRI